MGAYLRAVAVIVGLMSAWLALLPLSSKTTNPIQSISWRNAGALTPPPPYRLQARL